MPGGGLGEVHVARDEELGRTVALKEIQARHAANPVLRSRFVLEAEINGNLEHPGIVPVYGLGTYSDGRPFYAMRFVQGDAEHRLDQAMQSYEDYVSGFNEEAIKSGRIPADLRDALLEKPRQFYEGLAAELAAKPHPTPKERALLARGRLQLGRLLLILGRHDEAHRESDSASRLWENLAHEQPAVLSYRVGLARGYERLGAVLMHTKDNQAARQVYEKATAAYAALVRAQPAVADYRDRLAACHSNVGVVLLDMGDQRVARVMFEKAIALDEELVRDHPTVPEYRHGVAVGYANLGDHQAARGVIEKAIAVYESLVREEPAMPGFRERLASGYRFLADVTAGTGNQQAAVESYEKAIAVYEELLGKQPDFPFYHDAVGTVIYALAVAREHLGQHEATVERVRAAIGHHRTALEGSPQTREYRRNLSQDDTSLALLLRFLGRVGEAAEATRVRIKLWPDQPRELYDSAAALALCLPALDPKAVAQSEAAALRERLAGEAVATLRRAIAAGYADANHLHQDPDLAPLRGRDDFRRLLGERLDRGFPADPFAR